MEFQIPITVPEISLSFWNICLCLLAICGLLAIIFVILVLLKMKRAMNVMEQTKRFFSGRKEVVLKKCPNCGNFYDENSFCEKCGYKQK
ncbi:MAG: hypothetical protein ACPL1Y_07155 [Thermoplasmata archaeon]